MLQIEHLTLTHRKDLRTLVEDLSLVLNPGDKAALIGEEGNRQIHRPQVDLRPGSRGELLPVVRLPGGTGPLPGLPGPGADGGGKDLSVYDFCAQCPAFLDLDYPGAGSDRPPPPI